MSMESFSGYAAGIPSGATVLVPAGEVHNVDRSNRGANLAMLRTVASRSIAGVDDESFGTWETVVVTGGSGCVGTALLRLLRRMGVHRIVSIAHLEPTRKRVVPGVEYIHADITDAETIEALLCAIRPDLVLHLAGIRDPGMAERRVVDAVRSNVLGTEFVAQSAQRAGVPVTVAASTGKAMRLFTSDIYASSKQLLEYQMARAAETGTMRTGCARFTHIVDNSLIYDKMQRWATTGKPIRLHGPNVDLFVQSAREASQLLMLAARVARENDGPSRVQAITDLGWPPVDLLGLAMDVIEETGSSSPIISIGFPAGYEEMPYPGTTDPRTAGDHSPLFNCLEAAMAMASPAVGGVPSVGSTTLSPRTESVDRRLLALKASVPSRSARVVRDHLRATCLDYLRHRLDCAPTPEVGAMGVRGTHRPLFSEDHLIAHEVITGHLQAEPRLKPTATLSSVG